jgi:CRP/FNR family cyclic AMP-dependent transcriptional regulator
MAHRELLGSLSMSEGARPGSVDRLAESTHTRRLARGQILFVEGEPAEHLYVVASGRIKVVVTSPRGESLVLRILGAGETLGELAVLDGGPRSAGAEALDAVELAAIPAPAVLAFLRSEPEAALGIARDLAATVRRLTGSAADLVFLDLPRRVAKLLLDAATPPAVIVDLRRSQGELAAQLGATRQSVNRALGLLHQRGWVHTDPSGSLRIVDRAALDRYASS